MGEFEFKFKNDLFSDNYTKERSVPQGDLVLKAPKKGAGGWNIFETGITSATA